MTLVGMAAAFLAGVTSFSFSNKDSSWKAALPLQHTYHLFFGTSVELMTIMDMKKASWRHQKVTYTQHRDRNLLDMRRYV